MPYELRFGFTACPSDRARDAIAGLAKLLLELHSPVETADLEAQARGEAADPVGKLRLTFEGLERTLQGCSNETCTLSVDFKIAGK